MRTLFVVVRFIALAVVALVLAALFPEVADATTNNHVVFTHHYSASTTVTRSARAVSFGPSAQTLSFGGTAVLTYVGPASTVGAVYFDGQVLDCGAMGDALTDATTISLPWLWFGDTSAHLVEFRVYANDFVAGQACPVYSASYATQAVIDVQPYAPATDLTAPALGALVVGQGVDVSVDLGPLTAGFDWSFGGSVATVGMPTGLVAELGNASASDPDWSADNVAPVLHVHGTPTQAGPFTVTIAVADGLGAFATVDTTYSVQADVVVAPPAMTRTGSGSTTITVTSLPTGATLQVRQLARGITSATVSGNQVRLTTSTGFSGVIRQTVLAQTASKAVSLTLVLKVRPAAPTQASFRVLTSKHVTQVKWTRSANASGYKVLLGGRTVRTLPANTTTTTLSTAVNARTQVRVIAYGGDGLTSSLVTASRAR